MNKSIMSCIREHIRDQCPLLKDWEGLFPSVGIDAMEEEPASYMIEKTPGRTGSETLHRRQHGKAGSLYFCQPGICGGRSRRHSRVL